MVNKYRIQKAVGRVVFYTSIEIEAFYESEGLKIEYNDLYVEEEWITPVEFGIKYFYEHLLNEKKTGLYVKVNKLHTMIVDSSYIIVMYSTVKCLSQMFELSNELIKFNEQTGTFELSK